jgi:hypothetical protein
MTHNSGPSARANIFPAFKTDAGEAETVRAPAIVTPSRLGSSWPAFNAVGSRARTHQ